MPRPTKPSRSLETYKAKREFDTTPEPAGSLESQEQARRQPRRFFCVQKHLASRLHYDFRLEHDGVLLSWAVPKGPSLDPKDKRLAMMVEDHPVEYGDFEGVIPEGYGAGIVMLWDQGAWQPEDESADVAAALDKGQLKFRLEGVKLKGSWVLVRTRPRPGQSPGKTSWLLIKHRDQWAGPVDITRFAPLSVKSQSDLPDILAAEDPRVWLSDRPARSGQTGMMFEKIIEKAIAIQEANQQPNRPRRKKPPMDMSRFD